MDAQRRGVELIRRIGEAAAGGQIWLARDPESDDLIAVREHLSYAPEQPRDPPSHAETPRRAFSAVARVASGALVARLLGLAPGEKATHEQILGMTVLRGRIEGLLPPSIFRDQQAPASPGRLPPRAPDTPGRSRPPSAASPRPCVTPSYPAVAPQPPRTAWAAPSPRHEQQPHQKQQQQQQQQMLVQNQQQPRSDRITAHPSPLAFVESPSPRVLQQQVAASARTKPWQQAASPVSARGQQQGHPNASPSQRPLPTAPATPKLDGWPLFLQHARPGDTPTYHLERMRAYLESVMPVTELVGCYRLLRQCCTGAENSTARRALQELLPRARLPLVALLQQLVELENRVQADLV